MSRERSFNKTFKATRLQKINVWLEYWFSILSFRSWSSQTSTPCFIVFTLFLLPKSLAWTRFLWRAKAPRPPPGILLFPVSHVIHRHLNSNTPPDRRRFRQTPSKRTWPWPKKRGQENWKSGGIKDLFESYILDILVSDFWDFWNNCGPKHEPLLWETSQRDATDTKCAILKCF